MVALRLYCIFMVLYATTGQSVFRTTNPNDPAPVECIRAPDEDICSCSVNGKSYHPGETYKQVKDPRSRHSGPFLLNAADFLFVVDESGSMVEEQFWLKSMISQLDMALQLSGIGSNSSAPNRFGLIGFGTWKGRGVFDPTSYKMSNGKLLGTVSLFQEALDSLKTTGQVEDGYRAMEFAIKNYSKEINDRKAARQIVLVTDEDLDNRTGISFATMLDKFTNFGNSSDLSFKLNAIVNHRLRSAEIDALGVTAKGLAYLENSKATRKYVLAFNGEAVPDGGHGNTLESYVKLAWRTGGATWDLKKLSQGGLSVQAFTNAFTDGKVEEVIGQLYQCLTCMCNETSSAHDSICNITRVKEPKECDRDYQAAICEYKGQSYTPGETIRDFDIVREGTPLCVDITFVIDESGSMRTEQAWLQELVGDIDRIFRNELIGTDTDYRNEFSLVGFGSNAGRRGRIFNFTSSSWYNMYPFVKGNTDIVHDIFPTYKDQSEFRVKEEKFTEAIWRKLFKDGELEDGYSGILTAIKVVPIRESCIHHIILVTDEDRDIVIPVNKEDLLTVLVDNNYILSVAIDLSFISKDDGSDLLGCDHLGQGYQEVRNSNPPYRIRQNCKVKHANTPGRTTTSDYFDLANKTNGAAWDLKKLREGGLAARAFTASFVEVAKQVTISNSKACKECLCLDNGTVECQVSRIIAAGKDCFLDPNETVTTPPPDTPSPSPTDDPTLASCTSPYNTSIKFTEGMAISPPDTLTKCILELLCIGSEKFEIKLRPEANCSEVSCNNPTYNPAPDCCPVCTMVTEEPDDSIDYKNINSTGPDGRAVEVIPSFVKSIVGQNVFLFCKPTGFLSYTPAKWYKDGKPLILAEHDNMEVIQTLQLNIARFMEADAGFYTCVIHDLILDEMFGQTVQVIAGEEAVSNCFTFNGMLSFLSTNWEYFVGTGHLNYATAGVSFDFNPLSPNGVLFLASDDDCSSYLTVALCDGVLKVAMNINSSHTEINRKNVELNSWNTFELARWENFLGITLNKRTETDFGSSVTTELYVRQKVVFGEGLTECTALWNKLSCPMGNLYFNGSIKGVSSMFTPDGIDLNNPSIAAGYNIAHC